MSKGFGRIRLRMAVRRWRHPWQARTIRRGLRAIRARYQASAATIFASGAPCPDCGHGPHCNEVCLVPVAEDTDCCCGDPEEGAWAVGVQLHDLLPGYLREYR